MRIIFVFWTFVLLSVHGTGQELDQAEDQYVAQVRDACDKYRKRLATLIRKAEVVELAVLRFDDVRIPNENGADGSRFPVSPHEKTAGPLKTKMLDASERRMLLPALAKQLEKPTLRQVIRVTSIQCTGSASS